MTFNEELQLAKDMGVKHPHQFLVRAKLNYGQYLCGKNNQWYDYFGKKLVKLSLPESNDHYDTRTKKNFPSRYYTDEIFRINYELKRVSEKINKFLNFQRIYHDCISPLVLEACYKQEDRLKKRKSFKQAVKKNPALHQPLDFERAKNYPLLDIVKTYNLNPVRYGIGRYRISCPFHNEKTPSLVIFENDNKFKCFGCGEHGDVIDFVSKYERITNVLAVKKLCG